MKTDQGWMSAAEAARALGVNRSTLYAYVSRGYVRSEAQAGRSRERRYSREDVEALNRRKEERRDPEKAARRALHWGVPVLESAITLIANGRLYYRGYEATGLARQRSIAQVASLVWTGSCDSPALDTRLHPLAGPRPGHRIPFVSRAQSMLAVVSARDPVAFDLRPHAVAQTGWRILNLLAGVAGGSPDLADTIDMTLARAWGKGHTSNAALIRAALILSADHELNVSSFTARCVASAGSSPYDVVIAGLAAVEGTRHGGVSVRVEALLRTLRRTREIRAALVDQLRRGQVIDGFGHPLYRDADPRAMALMQMLRERHPRSAELSFAGEVARAAESLLDQRPTIDFALAVLSRVLRLPEGSALTLFAIGRTIGWIGHAVEQYAQPGVIRPRARYVGSRPAAATV
jgi:citrate synthase